MGKEPLLLTKFLTFILSSPGHSLLSHILISPVHTSDTSQCPWFLCATFPIVTVGPRVALVACLGWTEKYPILQEEFIWWIVFYAPYYHYFKASPVRPHDSVTTCLYRSSLSHLRTRLHIPVPPDLPRVVEEVHQPEFRQQFRNLLGAQVLGFADVGAKVPYKYGLLVVEGCHGLLQEQYVIWGIGREVCVDNQGSFFALDDLADIHIRPMEVHPLYTPYLGLVLDNQAYSPLLAVPCSRDHQKSHHILFHPTDTICMVVYPGLCQYNQVKAIDLYHPYVLHDPGSAAVMDVEGHEG